MYNGGHDKPAKLPLCGEKVTDILYRQTVQRIPPFPISSGKITKMTVSAAEIV